MVFNVALTDGAQEPCSSSSKVLWLINAFNITWFITMIYIINVLYNDVTWAPWLSNHWHLNCLFIQLYRKKYWGLVYWPFVKGTHWWLIDSPHKGWVTQQERLKCRNTLGCLNQYAAQNSKYARPPIPSHPPNPKGLLPVTHSIWSHHETFTLWKSMPRSCSNGCSLNWFTPSEFFKFSQLTN